MRFSFLMLFFTLLLGFRLSGQSEEVMELIGLAYADLNDGKYLEAGLHFNEVVRKGGDEIDVRHRYNAACVWALAGEVDSAFWHLIYVGESGKYSNLDHMMSDEDLYSLHEDDRWDYVTELVRKAKMEAERLYDWDLIAKLDTIHDSDQRFRRRIEVVREKYGWDPEEMKSLWDTINYNDSVNLVEVRNILDERGWLGSDIVGRQGNTTLFLVIQHADQSTQEHYLPMMRQAVKDGNAKGSSLALLEDRVALGNKELQTYGSQIGTHPDTKEFYVLPLLDPENVNKRRAEVGLSTIEEYIDHWDMKWEVDEYKKKLPEYIKLMNEK